MFLDFSGYAPSTLLKFIFEHNRHEPFWFKENPEHNELHNDIQIEPARFSFVFLFSKFSYTAQSKKEERPRFLQEKNIIVRKN